MSRKETSASLDRRFLRFRVKWGITEIVPNAKMHEMFSHHRYGQQDLDDTGWIKFILSQASEGYKQIAESEEVQALSKIKCRNALREAIYGLADDLVMEQKGCKWTKRSQVLRSSAFPVLLTLGNSGSWAI